MACLSFAFGFSIEQEFNIKTTKATLQDISKSKTFYGKVKVDENLVYDVNLRFDGYITDLFKTKTYQKVSKGDKLFQVYSKEIYNIFDELSLVKDNSQQIYNAIKTKVKLYDINPQDYANDEVLIYSKYDGYITQKNVNTGSFLKAGKKAFTITNLEKVWVIAKVYQKDLSFIKNNMDVGISIDGLAKKLNGKVDFIYPKLNEKDQTIDVRVIVDNKDLSLYPNMFVNTRFYEDKQNILTLPKGTIVRRDGKQYVFFKSGKTYEPSEVKAIRIGNLYHITEGLEVGDEVVMNALFLLDSDSVTNGLYSDDDW